MTKRRKILFGGLAVYVLLILAAIGIWGWSRNDNKGFLPQNEFKLDTWVDLPGPFDINKAVLYLVLAAILTGVAIGMGIGLLVGAVAPFVALGALAGIVGGTLGVIQRFRDL